MLRSVTAFFLTIPLFLFATPASAADGAPKSKAGPIHVAATDWPWWRGPTRDGIANADQEPPLHWSDSDNVIWKAPVPGRGHGSPTVVGNQVFLQTADEVDEIQSVICYDRNSGAQIWKRDLHRGGLAKKENKKSSHASATVACDGERLFVNFEHGGAIYATALDRQGNPIWQKKISDFVTHQGFGASPAVYQSLVLFSADHKGGGAIAALDRATGDLVWKKARPSKPNYTSPIVLHAAGRDQLVFTGCDLVSGFNPLTGEKLWEVEGATTECVTSTVTDGKLVFTSGGYPRNHVSAVRADGSGKIVWDHPLRVYVPSMLVREGHLYGVTDAGVAMCWKSDTGSEIWRSRLQEEFTASPVMVGDKIFATSEKGTTYLFKADPKESELVAENQLGDDVFASPAICGGRIYMRVAFHKDGRREEVLYCLGSAQTSSRK
jgi:outer membrane protein assembly factor BamB